MSRICVVRELRTPMVLFVEYRNQNIRQSATRSGNGRRPANSPVGRESAFSYARDFLENRFVYVVVSPRARGLSVGVNVNPIANCNFCCRYCEVDRSQPPRAPQMDVEEMSAELMATLRLAHQGGLAKRPRYAKLPEELLQLRHVALSGDGEPTLAANFVDVLEAVVHLRALGRVPFFKLVLLTNSTSLDQPEVQSGLKLLTREDEVWAKLDAGTESYLNRVSSSKVPLQKILDNILLLGRRRPLVIQSLFPAIDGAEPPQVEIEEYALRLKELKEDGAEIPLVQIYSATRPMARCGCTHLSLKTLSGIARTVRTVSGLRAEVF